MTLKCSTWPTRKLKLSVTEKEKFYSVQQTEKEQEIMQKQFQKHSLPPGGDVKQMLVPVSKLGFTGAGD